MRHILKTHFYAFLFMLVCMAAVPFVTEAAIVPCEGGSQCQACHLAGLGNRIIDFLIYIGVAIAVIMFMWAGFEFITAQGNVSKIKHAKEVFKDVFVGIVLALAAWLIIDIVMQLTIGGELQVGPWNTIQCVEQPQFVASNQPGGVPGVGVAPVTPGGPTSPGGTGTTVDPDSQYTAEQARAALPPGITVNNANECPAGQTSGCTSLNGINQGTIAQVVNIQQACGCSIVITGGTEGGHASGAQSHSSGFKVDLGLNPQLDATLKGLPYMGVRSDGAALYGDSAGNIYALEGNHWDITVVATNPLK